MAASKAVKLILLDSCSYFRLGVSFRPILFRLAGDPEYALKVLAELDREYSKNARLKTKFWWVGQKEYTEERAANCFAPMGKKVNAVRVAFSYIDQYAIDNNITVSLIDKRELSELSVGYACGGIVVTDDTDMQGIAKTLGISYLGTLDLLKLMHERGRATLADIDAVIEYWEYEKDFPTSFAAIKEWRKTLG